MPVIVKVDEIAMRTSFKKKFNNLKKNNAMNKEIGTFVVERARGFGKLGKPLNNTGTFPALKDRTIRNRKFLRRLNNTDPSYRAGKSNLTFTGQFWDSLKFRVDADGIISLFFEGKRKPYRTGPDSVQKKPPTNEDLQIFLSRLGFNPISAIGFAGPLVRKRINNIFRKFFRKSFRAGKLDLRTKR